MAIAVLASLAIAVGRIAWESERSQVSIAVDALAYIAFVEEPKIEESQLPSALLIKSEQLGNLVLDQLNGYELILHLDRWVSRAEFSRILQSKDFEHFDAILLNTLILNSEEHLMLMAERLRDFEMAIAIDEFEGSLRLARKHLDLESNMLRTHLISSSDFLLFQESERIARLNRALKERKVDLVALPSLAERDFSLLESELESMGLGVGIEKRPRFSPSPIFLIFIIAGLLAAMLLTLKLLEFPLMNFAHYALIAVGLLLITGLFAFENETRLLLAWITAVLAPVLGYALLKKDNRESEGLSGALRFTARLASVSMIGALVAAAFLTTDAYLLGIDSFRGVKAALILPLVLVGSIAIGQTLNSGIRWYDMIVLIAIGVVSAYMLLRSGNGVPTGLSASGWEQDLRSFLENTLYARPRFKEFLIGYPALMLLGGLAFLRRTSIGWGLLMLGMIGQVSIVNSFMHLHTPLGLTLLRELNGLWLGILIGLLGLGTVLLLSKTPVARRLGLSTS